MREIKEIFMKEMRRIQIKKIEEKREIEENYIKKMREI